MSIVDEHKQDYDRAIEHFQGELKGIRTGRATPALIENISVDAYGVKTPINQLGSINVADAKSMTVEPWDKNLLKEVEKAIASANLGLGAANEGSYIRVSVPPMTEENRKDLVRLLKTKTESARVAIRGVRDKVKTAIEDQEKNKEITEDDKYRLIKELDEATGKFNDQVKAITDSKEQEIMTV